MTTELPDSLARYGELLERAVDRDRLAAWRRRRRVRAAAVSVATAAIALGAVSLPGDGTTVAPPGVPAASAAERAAAVLSAAPGSIVHEQASSRHVTPDGDVETWRQETGRQTSHPYERREITTRGDTRIETATVGDRPAQLYDPSTNTIYTNPPENGPALGTPMPATDGDPLRAQMAELLRSRDARAVTRTGTLIRFAYTNPLPDGGAVEWTYVVDAKTYQPLRLTAVSPDGSRTTTRFQSYDALEPADATKALLDLRAQHPNARVDRTEAGYAAAQARLY